MNSEFDYVVFILSRDFLKNELPNENDLAYEICNKVARQFFRSGDNNLSFGLYECVEYYVNNNMSTIRELIKAHTRSAEQLQEKSTGELTEVLFDTLTGNVDYPQFMLKKVGSACCCGSRNNIELEYFGHKYIIKVFNGEE